MTLKIIDTDTLEQKTCLKQPGKFLVVMLNDDYTPMDFVVSVLMQVFQKSVSDATQIMLTVHSVGHAVCGEFTKDIALTKINQAHKLAKNNNYPLLCKLKQAVGDNNA